VSATSGTSSVTSGTLGDAAPVSFPGIASGIDYNSIIEKYTADTLQQEKPTQLQINNLTAQNTAITKITSLIASVQDALTALSNPDTFNAYKSTVGNTSSGSTAATSKQISGGSPVAGTYLINAQTVATATSITNNTTAANAPANASVALVDAGTSITPTNGTASNGSFTINGVQIQYNVNTDSLNSIVAKIQTVLTQTSGGTATLLANGQLQLTGVQSLGSGADSGNLEQVLKLDTAELNTLNPSGTLGSQNLLTTLNSSGTTGIVVNGTTVSYTSGETLTALLAAIDAVPGVTSTTTGTSVTLNGVTSLTDTGGGNLIEALGLSAPDTSTSGNLTGLSQTATLSADTQLFATPNATGNLVVNGVAVAYNASTTTVSSLILAINTSGSGATAAFVNGRFTITGATSIADSGGGNLVEAFALSTPSNTSTAQFSSVTSSAAIGGVNQNATLGQADNAGFTTQVTAGTFTINGVQFTVNPTTDSLSTLLSDINSSSAGVTATYNQETSSIQLTSTTAGPQSILLGASGDTSNFLQAAGFLTSYNTPGSINAGASQQTGTQASLTYTNLQGQTQTVYSSTNDFTSAIPGIDLNVNTSSPASLAAGSTYYSVTVAADPTQAEAAINKFITAYNAAIQELNKDTAAPTVTAGTDATTGTSSSASSGGGVLYGNYQISGLRDQLVQLVSGFVPSGSASYNSLQSVGILLDTNSQAVGTASDSSDSSDSSTDSTSSANNSFSVNATSGELQALDTTAFEAAYAANTIAVKNLFTLSPTLSGNQLGAQPVQGSPYGFSYLLGSSLANIDGLNTYFANDSVVTPDNLSSVLLTNITDSNNQQIDSLQQSITLINNEATQQADQLRAQFTASESQIAELQALQQQIAAIGH
jgi:flagellar capping protein FliD